VFANQNQQPPQIDDFDTVKPESKNRCPAQRRFGNHHGKVFVPIKVVCPIVSPWMEKLCFNSGDFVEGLGACVLRSVASLAGQRRLSNSVFPPLATGTQCDQLQGELWRIARANGSIRIDVRPVPQSAA
jgi:hypothetical protein